MPVFNEAPMLNAILDQALAQACVREVFAVDDGSISEEGCNEAPPFNNNLSMAAVSLDGKLNHQGAMI